LWTLNKDTLLEAKKALENTDIVIGPCYDGGYYLIGMKNLNKKFLKIYLGVKKKSLEKLCQKPRIILFTV
jgi:glycosyltransferase A (GT-A) superfamily protein (DUF2064 family)